jgi:hypothetical protein
MTEMGRSYRKLGPDFRVLRPDLEGDRKACRKPVKVTKEEEGIEEEVAVELEDAEFREMMEEEGRGEVYRV